MQQSLRIKGELVNRGISQITVANHLGIHINSLSNKLEGKTAFTVDEALEIIENYLPEVDIKQFSRNYYKGGA